MGNVKDEGKKMMDPLFPRLHISDADKVCPKPPPRNKMALSQHFNPPSHRCVSGSVSPVLPLPTNNPGRLLPTSSSYHDSSYKRSVFSSFGRSCGSTRLATRLDSYHSSGINLNISLTTVKQTIETTNCQTLCNTGLQNNGEYCFYKPQELRSIENNSVKKPEEENDYLVPSLSFANGQYDTDRGRFSTLSTNSHIKHPIFSQKQLKLTNNDTTQENKLNTTMIKDIGKEPVTCYSDRVQLSEMLNDELSPSKLINRSILIDEQQMLHDPNIRLPFKRKSFQENMAYTDGTKRTWTLLEDNGENDRGTNEILAPIIKNEEDHSSFYLGDDVKIKDTIGTNLISSDNIAPKEVSRMIGSEQYCRVRRTIVQQQRVFKTQLFELHRLIKVQKLLAESPNVLLEDSFYKLKKSPSEDIFPHLDYHQKKTNDTQKIYNSNLIDIPPPPPPPTITGTTQPPWCFLPPPPPGNQWLVPVRTPSEGLVYKPYTGAPPQSVGLMAPVYGMNLAPSHGEFLTNTYTIPTSYQQGISVFPSNPLFTTHGLPSITKFSCSPMIDNGVSYSKPIKTACKIESEEDDSFNERKKGDELPLFPTTPMVQDSADRCIDEKGSSEDRIKVIKVVPHNPKVASESAARIFEFIQEERKHNE